VLPCARSQMAKALLRYLSHDTVKAFSAGSQPAEELHPLAIKAMAELGIDISEQAGHRAKGIEAFEDAPPMDLVVTVCDEAAEECPYFPRARRKAHWGFPDPSKASGSEEERLAIFRQVRDAIASRIETFVRRDEEESAE
jgi:arsenate reductase (thioredoxin)